ncbi:BZ3500_MvSof-1268-A1-R1_Chr8-1g09832 [Microbotryum saponariae]|uniref:BZ3500_MvSof-1268-A1-R1_Chr8-1g09832 protein n=1 Tax=Microbotryum saponariae TaxID=289078 RepID=A0A2X0LA89_9BASI|nr:BZ3500_MvSof-1268-A1-R1_Chr8-1g09832 [Microbotryum saponariae]SDA08118.1 BZ3501_MvSof-1269-A2-R1_Chr8-1g09555 [Microbotryum saponariae]
MSRTMSGSTAAPELSARNGGGNGGGVGGAAGGNAAIAATGNRPAAPSTSNSVGSTSSNKPNDASQPEGAGEWFNDASEEGAASPEYTADDKPRRKRRVIDSKLKCDRGSPCGSCSIMLGSCYSHDTTTFWPDQACRDRQEGHLCEWEGAVRLPNPAFTRDQEAQDLRHQLDRLEGLLNILSGSEGEKPRANAEVAAARALGMLSVRVTQTAFERRSAGTSNGGSADSRGSVNGGVGADAVDRIAQLLPDQHELDLAIEQFLSDVVPFLPICHAPSFSARLRQFDDKNALEDPALLAIVLGILGLYSNSQSIEDVPRSRLSSGRALLNAFAAADTTAVRTVSYAVSPSLDSLRAQLIIHYHETSQDLPEAPFSLDAIIRSAQNLGLHCDSNSYRLFNCIELEERRRIWHYIISVDWLSNGGRTYTCSSYQYDTRFPANAFDVDITHDAVGQRPFGAATPTLYISHLAQIASASRTITERIFAVHTPLPVTWHAILQLSEELNRIEATFPGSFLLDWKGEVVRPLDPQSASLDMIRIKVIFGPGVLGPSLQGRKRKMLLGCVSVIHQILSIFRGYEQHPKLSSSAEVTHHALNAILVLAVDLLQDPEGPGNDFTRRQLTASIAILEGRQTHPVPFELQRECIRVASYLIRQSSGGPERSRKRTTPGGFPRTTGSEHPSTTLAPILSGPTSMRGIEMPFTVPMPLTIALDPFGSRRAALMSPSNQNEMAALWNGLRRWKGMYGLPDLREVDELVKISMGGRAFSEGIDLLQP